MSGGRSLGEVHRKGRRGVNGRKRKGMHRAALLSAVWAAGISSNARAATSNGDAPALPSNRLGVMLGLGLAVDSVGVDGNYENSLFGFAAGLSYGFRILSWLEVGGRAAYWNNSVRKTAFHTLFAGVDARPFFSIGPRGVVEIGGTLVIGGLVMYLPDAFDPPATRSPSPLSETWAGPAVSFGPDVRIWMGSHWGLQSSIESTFGKAEASVDPAVQGLYLSKSGAFGALGAWVGAFAGF